MPEDLSLVEAISKRDAAQIRTNLLAMDFFVLSVSSGDEEDRVPAMTTEVGGYEALVAFTSETSAADFVTKRPELFTDDEGVDGVVVEGATLLDSLPDGFGLLLDPGSDGTGVIDPSLASQTAAK